MPYRSEVVSVAGFVQQIACSYLRHGYWFYVTGRIPGSKDAVNVERKLLEKYGIGVSESTRARRKQLGQANLQLLRHGSFFAILATHGEHRFFAEEAASIRDMRRIPLRYGGYAISYRHGGRTREGMPDAHWHAHVEIERKAYLEIKARLLEMAVQRSAARVAMEFYELPYEPYAPIRRQMLNLLRSVNQARRIAGFAALPVEVVPFRRRIVKPFGEWNPAEDRITRSPRSEPLLPPPAPGRGPE